MNDRIQGNAPALPAFRAEKEPCSEIPNMMVVTRLLGSDDDGGSPHERGPLALCSKIAQALRSEAWHVWYPVLGKVLVGVAVLGGVTYLGYLTEQTEVYGEERPSNSSAGKSTATPPSPSPEKDQLKTNSHKISDERLHGAGDVVSGKIATRAPCVPLSAPKAEVGITADGRVILNEASAEALTRLPAVGPSRAEAIVKLRTRLGKFRKISDLLRVRGIGWKTLKKMKEKVLLNRPVAPKNAESEPVESPKTAEPQTPVSHWRPAKVGESAQRVVEGAEPG